ncbi:LysR family transcriptional regulator [Pediococcus pentosaceus]|uniref:LysR family transcriptional regulator n=1 Tax=Pediococcus pentosaceus TaxID=1255 RepID=UPI001303B3F1|nr:LysR family transcriptional regulator [Pediococcus pentosaceus]MDD1388533.1 LysR family transcriptional regulator [Pediococcus pentosaceus]QGZ69387.1 LysR family transcriptional regulator [Pediococcus pentosaceus]
MFNFLNSFRLVYETHSFSLAASQLFVTQPTVSNQIRQLEAQLKTQLFSRKGNSEVLPTTAAKILYESTTKLLAEWHATERELKIVDKKRTLKLKIGASQTIAQTVLPELVDSLHQHDPDLPINVSISNSDTVLEKLNNHKINIGLVEKPVISPSLERVSIASDELVCIGTPTDVWLSREPGSGIYKYSEQYLLEMGISPNKVIQVNETNLLIKLVRQGLGQTIISKRMAPNDLPITYLGPHFNRLFYLLYSKIDYSLDPHLKKILDTIQKLSLK